MKLVYNYFSLPSPAHDITQDSCRMLGAHARCVRQSSRGQLFGLFDGMGSLTEGGKAARYMGDSLVRYYRDVETVDKDILKEILQEANTHIASWPLPVESRYSRAGGCVGTVALFIHSHVRIFHTGDTVALLLKADYHSPQEYSLLTPCHCTEQGGLTSFWGIGDNLALYYSEHQFSEDDILLLASDGLTDVMDYGEISRLVRQMDYFTGDECAASCRRLCALARKRGSGDDITALLIYREE